MASTRRRLSAATIIALCALPAVAAEDVRDGAGNIIIRGDQAASRGMDPKKPFFTFSVDANGNYVGPGGGGGGTANPYPGADYSTSGRQDTMIGGIGAPADAASSANGSLIAVTKAARDKLLGTLTVAGTVSVGNFPATQAISAASLPLPTGAATAAKQPALGTAGTPSADVLSVQGVSGGTPQNAYSAQYNASLPTLASGASGYLAVDVNGRLIQSPGATVQLIAGSASIGSIGAGANNIGKVGVDAVSSSGGLTSVSRVVSSLGSTNATSAKAAPGRVYKITGFNAASSIRWLHLYNVATAPTVGSTAVFFALPLPPGAYSFDAQDLGYYFSTGIAYSITTGAGDADTTAVGVGDIVNQNVWYQ